MSLRHVDANLLRQFDRAEFVRREFDRGVGRHGKTVLSGEALALGGEWSERPIRHGNHKVNLISAHELEDEIYKLCGLAGGNRIIYGKAAVAREFGGSEDSPVGTHRDPVA